MAAGEGGRALGVAMSNPSLDGVKVPTVFEAESATLKMAFYGVTAVVQPSSAAQTTTAATWVTVCSTRGAFATSDDIITFINAVKQVQTVMKTLGLWKGTA